MRRPASALVLAAGASTRMAPANKLLLTGRSGVAMAGIVARACCESHAAETLVVLGHDAPAVQRVVLAAVGDLPVRFVMAADHRLGLSASLRAGLAALHPDAAACLVCLGDMPLVTAAMLDGILAMKGAIVVPTHGGQRGNPVRWDRRFFGEMAALSGDAGARSLLGRHTGEVVEMEVASDAVLRDFDTIGSLKEGLLF